MSWGLGPSGLDGRVTLATWVHPVGGVCLVDLSRILTPPASLERKDEVSF